MIPIIALISVAFASNPINWTVPAGITCPEEAAFVCGNNGENYHNECVAKANGITSFVSGRCIEKCPFIFKPVVGADGKTYSNKCLANVAGVCSLGFKTEDGKFGFVEEVPFVKESGSCDPSLVDCIKKAGLENLKPVCGRARAKPAKPAKPAQWKTYPNMCLAKADGAITFTSKRCPPNVIPFLPPPALSNSKN
jgi:hypothetical protein